MHFLWKLNKVRTKGYRFWADPLCRGDSKKAHEVTFCTKPPMTDSTLVFLHHTLTALSAWGRHCYFGGGIVQKVTS